jgi:hypothetical protein
MEKDVMNDGVLFAICSHMLSLNEMVSIYKRKPKCYYVTSTFDVKELAILCRVNKRCNVYLGSSRDGGYHWQVAFHHFLHQLVANRAPNITSINRILRTKFDANSQYMIQLKDAVLYLARPLASADSPEAVELLCKAGADPILKCAVTGSTAFFRNVSNPKILEIWSVLIKYGGDVNIADNDGKTVLHAAWQRDDVLGNDQFTKAVRFLLENGARLDAIDNEGKTPVDVWNAELSMYRHRDIVQELSVIIPGYSLS